MRQTGQRQRQRPVTENNLECPMPRERTDFWAGSVEKVEIMRHRLEAGEHLHHPYDCKQIIVDEQDPVTHANTFYQINSQPRLINQSNFKMTNKCDGLNFIAPDKTN